MIYGFYPPRDRNERRGRTGEMMEDGDVGNGFMGRVKNIRAEGIYDFVIVHIRLVLPQ